MCIDNSDLNKVFPKDCYPLLEISQNVKSLHRFRLKCFLDAYKWYHQILMSKEDEDKTTFYTDHESFYYIKMSFELNNAGTNYQRLVDSIFSKNIGRNIKVYINDMEETFKTLEKVMIKLNPWKWNFGVEEDEFLRYYVTTKGIQPNPTKVDELMEVPSPHTLRDARAER